MAPFKLPTAEGSLNPFITGDSKKPGRFRNLDFRNALGVEFGNTSIGKGNLAVPQPVMDDFDFPAALSLGACFFIPVACPRIIARSLRVLIPRILVFLPLGIVSPRRGTGRLAAGGGVFTAALSLGVWVRFSH
jgi:hypothetical protein